MTRLIDPDFGDEVFPLHQGKDRRSVPHRGLTHLAVCR